MSKTTTPFKVKFGLVSKYNEQLLVFQEMMESWKYNKQGRDYTLIEDKDNLMLEIIATSK